MRLKQILIFLLIMAFILGAGWVGPSLMPLMQYHLPVIVLLICLQILLIACGGFAFARLGKPLQLNIRGQDWFGLSFVASILNQLLPFRPGIAFRYWYLQRQYQCSLSVFCCIMFIYLLLTFISGLGFASLGFLHSTLLGNQQVFSIMLMILSLIVLIGFYYLPTLLQTLSVILPKRWYVLLASYRAPLLVLHRSPLNLISALLIFIVISLLSTAIYYFIFQVLSKPLAWSDCLILVSLLSLINLFPLTPGNIGVVDGLLGSFTQTLYDDFTLGITVMFLYRITQWLPALILGCGWSWKLIGHFLPKTPPLALPLKED